MTHITITRRQARRLALVRAGLLKPEWTGLPRRAAGSGQRARQAAHRIIGRFGYLQLDTVSVAGARSHAIILMSRLERFEPTVGEALLQPGEPLFEYWGHAACWMPLELYPVFDFRRRAMRHKTWWGDIVGQHPDVARDLMLRIRDEGPLRSVDMEGRGSQGWWDLKITKKVAHGLWSSGELAIAGRHNFQRTYDLTERVIPERLRRQPVPEPRALEVLLDRALAGHGWATTHTLVNTWYVSGQRRAVLDALERKQQRGAIVPCDLVGAGERPLAGWIRPAELELIPRLDRLRPRRDRGVLLTPFDPLLWDRKRVRQLFGFKQVLEIYVPAAKRIYGYFCLPVLAGESLVARVDLKAHRRQGTLQLLSCHLEDTGRPPAEAEEAVRTAIARFADGVGLRP